MTTNLLHHFFPQPSSSSSTPLPFPTSSDLPQHHELETRDSIIPDAEDDVPDEENIFRDMTFDEILEDLNARFLVNMPKEESSLVRVYWQAEQAHWFYEDYLRPLNPLLPSMSQRNFTHLIIASSPLYTDLQADDYDAVWEEYCRYKRMVPCCGGILFNAAGDKVLMVRGWKSNAGWCFPRGKINSEESEEACAVREVEEETGFDLSGRVISKDKIQTQIAAQTVTMFLVGGIDENTIFETQTRKEIGAIEWVHIADLPTWSNKKAKSTATKGNKKFYNVTPFVGAMKRWLTEHGYSAYPKRRQPQQAQQNQQPQQAHQQLASGPALRSLEPYQFDASPVPSPQPTPARHTTQPTHSRDQTALDNLFHRFVHKQEEEQDTSAGKENQAGITRLFGNLNVLRQEDEAVPTGRAEEERREDDALAKLLGGLTTVTPVPQARVLAPSDKASKLLAALNPPASPRKSPEPVKPHQASLLAMLSPKQSRPETAASTSSSADTLLPNHGKPMSLPTSPRPPSPTQETRARKQRALLEQITAGFGLDVPSNVGLPRHAASQFPVQASALQSNNNGVMRNATGSRSRDSSANPQHNRQTSNQRNSPSGQPLPPQTGRMPLHGPKGYTPPKETSPARAPPPPYDAIPVLEAHQGRGPYEQSQQHQQVHHGNQPMPIPIHPPPVPTMSGSMYHPAPYSAGLAPVSDPMTAHQFDHAQQPTVPHHHAPHPPPVTQQQQQQQQHPQQQQNLLNMLRSQPPIVPTQNQGGKPKQGPIQGYRPAQQPFPPQSHANNFASGPYPPHTSQGQGGFMGNFAPHQAHQSHHPLPVRPQTHVSPGQYPLAGYGYQPVPPLGPSGPGQSNGQIPPHPPISGGQGGMYGQQYGQGVPNQRTPPRGNGSFGQGQGMGQLQGQGQSQGQGQGQGQVFGQAGGGGGGGGTAYHHPVPRPPNSQAGTLLSMLNDGPK